MHTITTDTLRDGISGEERLTFEGDVQVYYTLFQSIKNTAGTKAKEKAIEAHKNDWRFKFLAHFLFDPFSITGIASSINKKVSLSREPKGFSTLQELVEYVLANNTGTNEVLYDVQSCIDGLDNENLRKFLRDIITKSYTMGAGAKTINKAYGYDFVPDFQVMLAEKYFENPDHVINKWFVITEKHDGIRCIAIVRDGKLGRTVNFFSRQGQPILGLVNIEPEMLKLHAGFYDGELIAITPDDMPSKEVYKRTTKIVRRDGDKHGVKYVLFDRVELDDYEQGTSTRPYNRRKSDLELDLSMAGVNNALVYSTPILYAGTDVDMINFHHKRMVDRGREGVMINIADAPYEFKRTKSILKVKEMKEADLEIIGYTMGEGEFEGLLGSLLVDYKGYTVGVGSGFTLAQRALYLVDIALLIGRVITVQYFEETQDEDGNLSLRFPIFVELREIGKEVSY